MLPFLDQAVEERLLDRAVREELDDTIAGFGSLPAITDLPISRILDAMQQVVGPARDMGLRHAPGQALVHRRAHRDLVDQAAVDARDRDQAARSAHVDHLAQRVRPVVLEQHHLLGAIEDRVRLAE